MLKKIFKKLYKKYALKQRYISQGNYKQLPEKMNEAQTKLIEVFKEMLYHPYSKLEYNFKTESARISYKQDDGIYYMHINEDNVRVVNTIHGYDTPISIEIHAYIMWLFYNKQNIDFTKSLKESDEKIIHSMDMILEKVRTNRKLSQTK